MCGVAGGSSKAKLSSHFAKADNIGELNAKDSSQETVISLLGMWAGGFVLSKVTSNFATWAWLLALLGVHLSTNYAAVRSVTLRTLNRQRANIVFSALMASGEVVTPEQAARHEFIFERDGILRWQGVEILGTCAIGLTLKQLLRCTDADMMAQTGSFNSTSISLLQLTDLFASEDYIMWFNPTTKRAAIVLKGQATTQTQLKAWSHALRVAWVYNQRLDKREGLTPQDMTLVLRQTLEMHTMMFDNYMVRLEGAGWKISTAALETSPGKRIIMHDTAIEKQA